MKKFLTILYLMVTPAFAVGPSSFSDLGQVEENTAEFFSFDGPLRSAVASHSFVRFTKKVNGRVVETIDISWLPAPEYLRRGRLPFLARTRGHNHSLQQTLDLARTFGRSVLYHGKFEITPELFARARRKRNQLEAGGVLYKMIDNGGSEAASNCIHAISSIVGPLNTGLAWGETGTNRIIQFFFLTQNMRPLAFNNVPGDFVPPSQNNSFHSSGSRAQRGRFRR